MRLSKEAIEEFQEIWYEEFGGKISEEKAREKGESLISLFKIIYRPIPKPKEARENCGNKTNSNPEHP